MNSFWQDLRYGARRLRAKPGFTLIAILTLSLGIGANTAIFSVVTSVLLAPLPFADSDRLMRVYTTQTQADGQTRQTSVAPADFHFLRMRSQLLERVAASRFRNLTMTGDGEPERLIGIGVSDQWLETLGVQPLLGRGFDPQEQAGGSQSHVALISYAFWQRRFGGQPEVIGRTLRLNEQNYTVIGVMPAQFRYPYNADLWMPVTLSPTATSPGDLNTAVRLKPGVTEGQFGEELRAISAGLAREFSGNRGVGLGMRPFLRRPVAPLTALVYRTNEQWEQAALAYDALRARRPEHGRSHYNAGVCWLRAGKPGAALPALERAWELKERPPQTAYTLGVAFALNGEPDRAFEWLEQALKLNPQNREALRADARLSSLRADPRFKALIEK